MWDWSRNSECGRATWTRAVLAKAPWGKEAVALRAGLSLRLEPPFSRRVSLGLYSRRAQSAAWKYWLRAVAAPRAAVAVASIDFGSQPVGLRMKPGRSRSRATERTTSGRPWRIWGIGSETAVMRAVSESTRRAVRTATTPRVTVPSSEASGQEGWESSRAP